MKIDFMGNGLHIKNVLESLISDSIIYVYHIKSQQHYSCSSSFEILDFMLEQGFADVFILRIEPVGEKEYYY